MDDEVGVWVETMRGQQAGRTPQLVPAWMIQIAWDWLHAHGRLTNRFLVADVGLNVKGSSFVCALLPEVEVASTLPIELVLRPMEERVGRRMRNRRRA